MKSWIKEGIIGFVVGLILHLYFQIIPFFVDSLKDTACINCFYSPDRLIIFLVGGFIIGALIGWIVGKIKDRNNSK